MAKGKKKLEVVHLVCEETGDVNYTLRRKSGGEKLHLKKYYMMRIKKQRIRKMKRNRSVKNIGGKDFGSITIKKMIKIIR